MSEPTPTELFAFEIVRRVTRARVEHYDTNGRQGAVDALLHLENGRVAALEVTTYADPDERELAVRLANENHSWPNPGAWWWSITVGAADDINPLRRTYSRVIQVCEDHQTSDPTALPPTAFGSDADLRWLTASTSRMTGHPDVPAHDGTRVRTVMVVPEGGGGAVDVELRGLGDALTQAFNTPSIERRLKKLLRSEQPDRHLFLFVGPNGPLPFPTAYALNFEDTLPPAPPPLPVGVGDLWLAPTYGSKVLRWHAGQWTAHALRQHSSP